MTDDKVFRFTLRVHWSDADPAGIVYFSRFFNYFELAEFELYRTLGREVHDLLNEQGIRFPRVEAYCRYIRPIRWDDVIEIHLWVAQVSSKSATYQLKVFRQGETDLLAEGCMTVVCIDQKTFRARPIPPVLRDFLRARVPSKTDPEFRRLKPKSEMRKSKR